MADDDNPYTSPEARQSESLRPPRIFSSDDNSPPPPGGSGGYTPFGRYCALYLGSFVGLAYTALAITYPLAWATLTLIALALGFGLLTMLAKIESAI
jgi:hypothetical protein